MATINATLSLTSADLTSNSLALSKSMTMSKAGSENGLEFTSGLVRRKFTSTNHVDLITAGAQNYGTPTASDSGAAGKVYIKNTGSSSTDYLEIGLGTSSGSGTATTDAIAGGDWMLIPYHGKATVGDITVKPSVATEMTTEFMVFFE